MADKDTRYAASIVTDAKLNVTAFFHGTTLPTTNFEVDAIFLLEGTGAYRNTGTYATPVWTLELGIVNVDNSVYPYSTTIGDYSTPTGAVSSSNAITPGYITHDHSTTTISVGAGNLRAHKFTGLVVGATIDTCGFQFVTGAGNIRVKVYQDDGTGGVPGTLLAESGAIAANASGIQDFALSASATVPASGNVWVAFENSATIDIKAEIETNGKYVSHTFGAGPSPFGTPTGDTTESLWERIHISDDGIGFPASNTVDNNTATEWKSLSEVNPNIYVTLSASADKEPSAIAIYYDNVTTVTQIQIDTSPDASAWTTVRKVNTSLLTNGAYNYIRWNRGVQTTTTLVRYVRIRGTDAGAKILAIWEIKVLVPTESTWNRRHGHKVISSTDATLALTT